MTTKTCPNCKGGGEGGFGFVSRTDENDEDAGGVERLRCRTCSGKGIVPADYDPAQAKLLGVGFETVRRHLNMTLGEFSRAVGLRTSELSRIEKGLPWDKEEIRCSGEGNCHGCLSWCNRCGDVEDMCDDPMLCDQHRRCEDCNEREINCTCPMKCLYCEEVAVEDSLYCTKHNEEIYGQSQ